MKRFSLLCPLSLIHRRSSTHRSPEPSPLSAACASSSSLFFPQKKMSFKRKMGFNDVGIWTLGLLTQIPNVSLRHKFRYEMARTISSLPLRSFAQVDAGNGKKEMESKCEGNDVFMFSDKHLGEMSGLERGRDTIQVLCRCICQSFGDAPGRIKVFASGDFEISCECTPGSQEDSDYHLMNTCTHALLQSLGLDGVESISTFQQLCDTLRCANTDSS